MMYNYSDTSQNALKRLDYANMESDFQLWAICEIIVEIIMGMD